MNFCLHEEVHNDICVSCGYTIDSIELVSYVTHMNASKNKFLNYKYTISNNTFTTREKIRDILIPLNKQEYEEEIYTIITTKKFTKRMNVTDKIIITCFYVLKKNNIPILPIDLKKFSKKGSNAFIKMYFQEFTYLRSSKEYQYAVIGRIIEFCISRGEKVNKDAVTSQFDIIIKSYEGILNITDVILYCIFHEENEIMWELTEKDSYKKTIFKIQQKRCNKPLRNNGVIERLNRALAKISKKALYGTKYDDIDLFIEKMILDEIDVNEIKLMTMKEIKNKMKLKN
ncbi:hypothetical protein COBT_003672 [Conglomerata obtusa]